MRGSESQDLLLKTLVKNLLKDDQSKKLACGSTEGSQIIYYIIISCNRTCLYNGQTTPKTSETNNCCSLKQHKK